MSVNGLEKITEKILADARAEADRILAEAEADCAAISADYAARADAIREQLSLAAEQKGADMVSRARSAATMQKRNLLLQQQSELIDAVFVGAREWVLALQGEKYAELLAGLLSSALFELWDTEVHNRTLYGEEEELAERLEVLFNKKDREAYGAAVLESVRKKQRAKLPAELLERLVVSKDTMPMDGGVVLRAGEVEFNCSFEMLFDQLYRELEPDVCRALFEERGLRT